MIRTIVSTNVMYSLAVTKEIWNMSCNVIRFSMSECKMNPADVSSSDAPFKQKLHFIEARKISMLKTYILKKNIQNLISVIIC